MGLLKILQQPLNTQQPLEYVRPRVSTGCPWAPTLRAAAYAADALPPTDAHGVSTGGHSPPTHCPRGVYGRPFAADALPTGCLRATIRRRRIAHGVSTGGHSPPMHCPRGADGRLRYAPSARRRCVAYGCPRAPTGGHSPPTHCPRGAHGRPFAAASPPSRPRMPTGTHSPLPPTDAYSPPIRRRCRPRMPTGAYGRPFAAACAACAAYATRCRLAAHGCPRVPMCAYAAVGAVHGCPRMPIRRRLRRPFAVGSLPTGACAAGAAYSLYTCDITCRR
ncbi:MAG: hypothetical protein FWE59_05590 [Oscillospiraceae bacterium]|nr:hypothetical protein [Oscillospiraceae bacterium]